MGQTWSRPISLFTWKPEPNNSKSQLVNPCPQLSKEGSQLYIMFQCLISRFAHLFLLALYQDIIERNNKENTKKAQQSSDMLNSHNLVLHQGISLLLLSTDILQICCFKSRMTNIF